MQQLIFDCHVCAVMLGDGRKLHLLSKSPELTLHEWFSQCSGCGTFGIKLVDESLVLDR
jgi:hypothetical protein